MDLQRSVAICLKFLPNQFNRSRCQNCFRSINAHSDEALHASKMNRKITKCGFLYVAPEGVDFNIPTHRSKRWQRRWFALYDDGELSYALDQHADTVPQGVIDMTACTEVMEAEDTTGHSHSLRVTTKTEDHYYIKADTAEEIRWWQDLLCIYSKQSRRDMGFNLANGDTKDMHRIDIGGSDKENGGPTLIQVKNSPFRDRSQRRTSDPLSQAKVDVARSNESSFHGTPRSVKNRKTTRFRDDVRSKTFSEFDTSGILVDDNSSSTKESTIPRLSEEEEIEDFTHHDSGKNGHWTVQLKTSKNGGDISRIGHSNGELIVDPKIRRDGDGSELAAKKERSCALFDDGRSTKSEIPTTDRRSDEGNRNQAKDTNASLNHTLRKGWLMLKGRSDSDWTKHWVVLAGLSLKMYKDAWAEDGSSEATIQIDLSDCEAVQQISAARNYGIEIKCKHTRYVLSALTPGIRESWIAAIQQNLVASAAIEHNNNNHTAFTNSNNRHEQPKKRRIAYVAPESHRRDVNFETDGDEDDEDDMESYRSNSRADDISVSERSLESAHDMQSDDGDTAIHSGSSTPRRRRSLSPTVRRSPVSRVKERDTSRRQRSPAQQQRARSPCENHPNRTITTSAPMNGGPVVVHSEVIFEARNLSTDSNNARVEANVIAMLQNQLETVRQELERTRSRLSETESENERMRYVTNGDTGYGRDVSRNGSAITASASASTTPVESEAELDRLRKTLQEAERDIWSKQEEIEVLTRKLDYSVNELSDTETVLSSSLHDLDSDRAKFSTLSEDWSRRVNAMERQLRETIRRLDERERELIHERSMDQQKLKESTQHQVQRRRASGVSSSAERNDINVIAQLESKLAESESKVTVLNEKLQQLQSRENGAATASKDILLNEDGENEIRFESLRQYCHDQNRRLLATLKNETEFLQTIVETKLSTASTNVPELKELADDLIAVHQYVNEIDQHLHPGEKSTPNEFMKDFNFKDVLNRLVEVQERFATLTKRDETSLMAVNPNGFARNWDFTMHDNNELRQCVPSSDTNNVALPLSDFWNYPVSVLHADLARSLAAYLERKYDESTHCTVLTADDFSSILTEIMALEACLLAEIANVIESSKNEERLHSSLKLRDLRNAYVILRKLDEFLNEADDDERILAALDHRLDTNFFNILCSETKKYVLAQLNDFTTTLPPNWKEKLRFGPADSDARVAALKVLSKNLLRDVITFDSNMDETASCSLELLRSTILKDEVTHILSRIEVTLDAFDLRNSTNTNVAKSAVAEAALTTVQLCDNLMEKINARIDKIMDDARDGNRSENSGEFIRSRVSNFLRHLKQSNSTSATTSPLGGFHSKMVHIDGAFLNELDAIGTSFKSVNHDQADSLASLLSARGVVRGYRTWIESTYGGELMLAKATPKSTIDFRGVETATEFRDYLSSASNLLECVAHYEPLTKQLFYRILSNVGTKLVAAQLSVFYECQMREMASAQENLIHRTLECHRCEWCGNANSNMRQEKIDDSLDEENPYGRRGSNEELEQLRRQMHSDGSNCGAPTNLAGEVAELEQEIMEMQSYHNEELESLRNIHESEVETLRRELATEQERRRKLYTDMEAMKTVTDHSLAALERAHTQLVEEIRDEHRRELQRLEREYERSLREEKEATRQALDALQKAHEIELHKQVEKMKTTMSSRHSLDEDSDDDGHSSRHDMQMALQELSRELSELSAAYSAKCLENSRVEDELEEAKKILDQMVMSGASSADERTQHQVDAFFHRSDRMNALQAELNAKESDIRGYEDRVRQLESDLMKTRHALASVMHVEMESKEPVATASAAALLVAPAVSTQNGHGERVSTSSSSSEELDDEDEEDDIAAEYQPKTARRRRGLPVNRRGDSRYHSTPNLGTQNLIDSIGNCRGEVNKQRPGRGLTPDRILAELRNVMGLPVSERRKYFENLCNQ